MPVAIKLDTYLHREPSAWWFVLCLLLIATIAAADYATGYELSLSILYLAPIFISAWIIGRDAGLTISMIATVAWLVSTTLTGHPYSHPFYHFWDAAIKFVTFAIFAVIMSRLKIALSHADERFVTVLEGLDAAVYVTDANGELLYANEQFHKAFGSGDVLPHALRPETPPLPSGGPSPPDTPAGAYERELYGIAGKRWYLIHSRIIRWVDGRTVRLQLAADITDRKQTEELNRQQQEKLQMTARLITIGELASTLAHEMNQPLAAIANYTMGCVRRLRSGNWDARELLTVMEKASAQAERAGKIIQRVREFVRKREPSLTACDLNEVIRGVAALIEIETEKNSVRLSTDLAGALPLVRADPVMIEQVILNLVKNAIEAMRETPTGDRLLSIRSTIGAADTVEVAVSDRGHGVGADFDKELLSPFFTTKPQGMGLGLHICRSIIEIHSGRLWFSRNPAGGTTFHFSLPVAPS